MADVVLVPGFWLGGWAWDEVAPALREAGHDVWAVTLPGLESAAVDRRSIGLEDHVRFVADLMEREDMHDAVLVGHSGAGAVVHGAIDRVPERVGRAVYVDSGPQPQGLPIRGDLGPEVVELPAPDWPELAATGRRLEGVDEAHLAELGRRAVPHPAGPARDALTLRNPVRLRVPVTVLTCMFAPDEVRRLASEGNPYFSELPKLDVTYVHLPTGHWPMFSRPADLARELLAIADSADATRRLPDAG